MKGLNVGSVVCYVLESGRSKGHTRPAIVVRDWSGTDTPYPDGTVNLQVFTDGLNDGLATTFVAVKNEEAVGLVKQDDLMVWRTSIHYSVEKTPGTWHWKEEA